MSTHNYVAANGVAFTDADVERWADEAEAGFPHSTLTRETPPTDPPHAGGPSHHRGGRVV